MDNNQNNYTNPYGEPQQNQYEAPQQNAYSAPSYSQPAQASSPVAVKVLSIVSLVTGIVGLVFCWCYGSLILASIAAIVTSTIAKNKASGSFPEASFSLLRIGVLFIHYFFLAFTSSKYSFVSLNTTGLNNPTAIKLGIAIRPFNVSAIAHASESSTAPAIQANKQKMI